MADDPGLLGSVSVQIGANMSPLEAAFARAEAATRTFDTRIAAGISGAVAANLNSINSLVAQTSAALAKVTAPAEKAAAALRSINSSTGVNGSGYRSTSADIQAYGKALDDVRAKFNPLFAAERQHNALLQEMVQAARSGAISADELFAAIAREEGAFRRNAAAANASNAAMKGNSFAVTNLGYQLNDIFTQLASGQNVLTIAAQQGPQITQAFGTKGAAGAVGMLGAAFAQVVNPLSLVTLGVIALGGFGVQALVAMLPKVKTLDELLIEHTQIIGDIKQAWAGAAAGLDAYDRKSQTLLAAQARTNASLLGAQSRQKNDAFFGQVGIDLPDLEGAYGKGGKYGAAGDYGVRQQYAPFEQAIRDLRAQAKAGKPDFDAFYDSIEKKVSADPGLRTLADGLEVATKDARDLAQALGQAGAAAQTIGTDKYSAVIGDFAAVDDPRKRPGQDLTYSTGQTAAAAQSAAAYRLQLQAITALSPAQQGQIAFAQKKLELSKTMAGADFIAQEAEQARTVATTQAEFSIGQATQSRLLAVSQSIDAARLQLRLVGQSVGETTRLTFVQQQLASAYAEAQQNGVSVSQSYIDSIKVAGVELGKLQQQLAQTQLRSNLMFDRSQMGRSPVEQTVASTLRPIYGDDLTSPAARADADLVRFNESLKRTQALAASIADSLTAAFSKPFTTWQGALDGVLNSFAQIGQQAMKANLTALLNGTSVSAANDNGSSESWTAARARVLGDAVKDGAQKGTFGGFGDFLKNNSGNIGAGLGGLGAGYASANPIMGAASGALAGASAGPWGAVIGGVAGLVGGLLGMNEALEKSKKALKDNRVTIEQFISNGLTVPTTALQKQIIADTMAVAQFKAQGAQLVEVAKAAGDTRLIAQLKEAMNAYRGTLAAQHLQDKIEKNKSDLIDAYRKQADGLQAVIDKTNQYIASLREFQDSLKLDKSFSPLNPEGMLAEAQKQFGAILAKANGGDANAQGRLQGAASSYLGAARGYLGSSSGYQDIFDKVQSALDGAVGSAQGQVTGAEAQLAATNKSLAKLGDIHSSIIDSVSELKALSKLEAAASKLRSSEAKALKAEINDLRKTIALTPLKRVA